MATIREICSAVRAIVDDITPIELPGRRFEHRSAAPPDDRPASDREYRVRPALIDGLGTPLCRALSVARTIVVEVRYIPSPDFGEDEIRIIQDAEQIATAVCLPPNPGSSPWHNVDFAGHSIEREEESAVIVSLIRLSVMGYSS